MRKGNIEALVEQEAVYRQALRRNDCILVCSDGLSDMVSDMELLNIVTSEHDLKDKADLLIEKANENGGRDNITALLVRVDDLTEEEMHDGDNPELLTEPDIFHKNYPD